MAWQLHYTSARSGPTGRAGFQYVAATPGMPAGWESAAAPYLVYRPPPEAPPAPRGDAELRAFPESFGYDLIDGHALLVRCRYLGKDYSGRYGNFLGHAVVAERDELEGLRPIELWRSPIWSGDGGSAAAGLPVLYDLVPGDSFGPEALGRWLGGTGGYRLLADLLDAVVRTLNRGHGRIVLVSADTEVIARWIAVVSYSLPMAAAARLSFVTYSADPDTAPQRLVGTTPGVWESLNDPGPVFFVDHPDDDRPGDDQKGDASATSRKSAGGFGRMAADCWRALDLDGLDAIAELAAVFAAKTGRSVLEGLGAAATAAALFHHDPDGTGPVRDLVALAQAVDLRLMADAAVPVAQLRAAVAECVRRGEGDLAAAFDAVPPAGRRPLLEGALVGLEGAGETIRRAMLTEPACDALFAFVGGSTEQSGWLRWPATGLLVLASVGRRRPEQRLGITRTLVALGETGRRTDAEAVLRQIWSPQDGPRAAGRGGIRARLLAGGRERRGEPEG